MSISISELEKYQEYLEIGSIQYKLIDNFLDAINDWPNPINSLEEFEKEIECFIKGKVTKERIISNLKNIDLSKNSWQAESLTQLIDVFQFFEEGLTFNEITMGLKDYLENNKFYD